MGRPSLAIAALVSGVSLLLAGCGGNDPLHANRGAPSIPVSALAHHQVVRSFVLDTGAFAAQPPGGARAKVSLDQAQNLIQSAFSHLADGTTYDSALVSLGRVTISVKHTPLLPAYQDRLAWIGFIEQFKYPSCPPTPPGFSTNVTPFFYVVVLDAESGKAALEYETEGTGDCGGPFGGPFLHQAKELLSVPWAVVGQQSGGLVVSYTIPPCGTSTREASYLTSAGTMALFIDVTVPLDPPPSCPPARTVTRSWPGGNLGHAPTGLTSGVVDNSSPVMLEPS